MSECIGTVEIQVEDKAGTFYVSSQDVPGLHLWGENPEDVYDSVIPTIQALYKHNEGLDVEVREIDDKRARVMGFETHSNSFEIYRVAAGGKAG